MKLTHLLRYFPFLLVLYEIAAYLSNDMYLPALPQMSETFNLSPGMVQLSVTAWILGASIWQLVLGPMADRHGRRLIFLCGGVLFVLSSLACAFSMNYSWLMVARFLQGSTACIIMVCGYATVHALYDTKIAIKTTAWMLGITILAPAFGPLLGALVLKFSNWRVLFLILAVWSSGALILLYFHMPETHDPAHRKSSNFRHAAHKYGLLLRDPQFMLLSIMGFLIFGAMISWIVVAPMLIMKTMHYSMFMYCLLQVLVFGSFIAGTHTVNLIIAKYTPVQLIRFGVRVGLVSGLLLLGIMFMHQEPLVSVIICLMIFCFGAALGCGSCQRLALENPTGVDISTTMALYSTLMSAGAFAGSLLVSVGYQHNLWPLTIIFSSVSLIAYVMFYFVDRAGILKHHF